MGEAQICKWFQLGYCKYLGKNVGNATLRKSVIWKYVISRVVKNVILYLASIFKAPEDVNLANFAALAMMLKVSSLEKKIEVLKKEIATLSRRILNLGASTKTVESRKLLSNVVSKDANASEEILYIYEIYFMVKHFCKTKN